VRKRESAGKRTKEEERGRRKERRRGEERGDTKPSLNSQYAEQLCIGSKFPRLHLFLDCFGIDQWLQ